MKLKKSVKLMKKLLPYPDYLKEIQLTPSDYEKIKPKIKMMDPMFGYCKYESYAGYPVKCMPELKESQFIIVSRRYTCDPVHGYVSVYGEIGMQADLSYMEGLKME